MADEDSRVLELLKVLGGLGSGAALVSTLLTPPRLVLEVGRLEGDHASAADS